MMRLSAFRSLAVLSAFHVLRVMGCLPLTVEQKMGRFIGRVLFYIDARHRKIVYRNLRFVFGKKYSQVQFKRLAIKVFENLGQIPLEVCWSLRVDPPKWKHFFQISGAAHYHRAMAHGKGVLFLTAHLGNWELFPIVAAMLKIPVHIVYRPLDSPLLNELTVSIRNRFGAKLLSKKKNIFKISRVLKNGECIAILLDQNVDWYEGVFVDFMNHRACTSKGLAALSILTGAPVVPVFLTREQSGFRAWIEPAIHPLVSGDRIRDLEDNTQTYNSAIESFVRRYPDQWFWVHQRWKTRPYHPIAKP